MGFHLLPDSIRMGFPKNKITPVCSRLFINSDLVKETNAVWFSSLINICKMSPEVIPVVEVMIRDSIWSLVIPDIKSTKQIELSFEEGFGEFILTGEGLSIFGLDFSWRGEGDLLVRIYLLFGDMIRRFLGRGEGEILLLREIDRLLGIGDLDGLARGDNL